MVGFLQELFGIVLLFWPSFNKNQKWDSKVNLDMFSCALDSPEYEWIGSLLLSVFVGRAL